MSLFTIRQTHFSDSLALSLSPGMNLVFKIYTRRSEEIYPWRNEHDSSSQGLRLHIQAPVPVYLSLKVEVIVPWKYSLFVSYPSIYLGRLMLFPGRAGSWAYGPGSHTLGWSSYSCPQVFRVQRSCVCTESLFVDFSHGMSCWGSHIASAVSCFTLLTTLR